MVTEGPAKVLHGRRSEREALEQLPEAVVAGRAGSWWWAASRGLAPPPWVQNLILPSLSALAKVFGVRPYYERWDTRISAPSVDRPRSELTT